MSENNEKEMKLFGGDIVFMLDGEMYCVESLHQTIEPNIALVVKLKPRNGSE